jgi:(R,R)-butanediol dehydrogenase/meso-butanediol dehydrogenase/diacetyl reductase
VVLGLCTKSDTFQPAAALLKEVTIQFSIVYDLQDYRLALSALASGAREPRTLVSDRIALHQLPEMFERLRHRNDHCKVMINPAS